MWRLASAAVPIAILVIFAASGLTSRADTPTPTPEPSPSASASPSPSPEPSREPTAQPLPPAPEPTPFDPKPATPPAPTIDPTYTGSLRPGDWVQIAGTDSCLNMRYEPRMPVPLPDGTVHDNVMNCLPDGFVGRLDGFNYWTASTVPVNSDGHWWWHILGQGWAAEEFLKMHHQGGIPWPERPELAATGPIAYIGADNGIWLMNADGSNAHSIVGGDQNQWVQALQWSPLGDSLTFSVNRSDGTIVTRVIDVNGHVLREIVGLADPRWSPGGGRLTGIRGGSGGMGGYQGTPVVFDIASGTEWAIGPNTYYQVSPAWSPDGNSLAFVCTSGYVGQPDGTMAIEEGHNCQGDGLRVVSVDGSSARVLVPMDPISGNIYYSNPSWSQTGSTIAVYSMQQDNGSCRGYVLLDVASGSTGACVPLPPQAMFIGGRCGGGPEMGASTWTPDGQLIFAAQGAGQSGVFAHDLATGVRTVVPNMNAGPATLSSDGRHITFAGAGHIWVAGLDGSNLTLLDGGSAPAWRPLP